MPEISFLSDQLLIDGVPFHGFELLGINRERTHAIIRLQQGAAFDLAKVSNEPARSIFLEIVRRLPEVTMIKIEPQPPPTPREVNLPKALKPYLRYTRDKMNGAWERSTLNSFRHYVGAGYVRLYLDRRMLIEMYRVPSYLKKIYADMLYRMDVANEGSTTRLVDSSSVVTWPYPTNPKFRPYEQLNESEMRSAIRTMGLTPKSLTWSYGLLAVSLVRFSVYELFRNTAKTKSLIAYLLREFDKGVPNKD